MSYKIKKLQDIYIYNQKGNAIKFHMPGNFGGANLDQKFKNNMALFDTTEVIGMDDYHSPEGIIQKLETSISNLFKSSGSISLVNGSTAGIVASMSFNFKEGDQVLIPRDSHKSVISGLVVSGATPVLGDNDFHHDLGIYLPLGYNKIKKILDSNPKIKGIVLTSPNYYGIGYKDLIKVVALCSQRDIRIIVDEAHGSHLYFTKLHRYLANTSKVEVVINSFHKNLTGLTQTGCINLNSKEVSASLRKHVSLVTTTSPSYVLLTSMAFCVEQYNKYGLTILNDTVKKSLYMKELLDKYKIRYIKEQDFDSYTYLDPTKITLVLDNNKVAEGVFTALTKSKIVPEMIVDNKILFMINKDITFRQIAKTVFLITKNILDVPKGNQKMNAAYGFIPKQVITPREAFYSTKEKVPLNDAVGRIAGEAITPYPPGIPITIPGQEITKEVVCFLNNNNGSTHGVKNGIIEVVNKRERV